MRPRVFGEALEAHEVNKLITKFDYPDEIGGGGVVLGGGGGAPTVVVAASDASDLSKSKADIVCEGDNDEDQIQAADTIAASVAGRILLTEGTFDCSDDITLSPRVSLQGMGGGTTLAFDSAGIGLNAALYSQITDMEIDARGFGVKLAGAGSVRIVRILFTNPLTTEACVEITSTTSFLQLLGCYSEASGAFVRAVGSSVHLQESIIADNIVEYSGTSGPSADPILDLDESYHVKLVISGNVFDNGTGIRIGSTAVGSPAPNHVIKGNTFSSDGDGIYLARSGRSIIANNQIRADSHGISVDECDDLIVQGNTIEFPGSNTTNTYDGIIIDGPSSRNLVEGNKIMPRLAGNTTRYGVNIATTDECNIVVGNDLGDPDDYGTDALNDNGANTQLFYPNDATYGDNFTDCGTGS